MYDSCQDQLGHALYVSPFTRVAFLGHALLLSPVLYDVGHSSLRLCVLTGRMASLRKRQCGLLGSAVGQGMVSLNSLLMAVSLLQLCGLISPSVKDLRVSPHFPNCVSFFPGEALIEKRWRGSFHASISSCAQSGKPIPHLALAPPKD